MTREFEGMFHPAEFITELRQILHPEEEEERQSSFPVASFDSSSPSSLLILLKFTPC